MFQGVLVTCMRRGELVPFDSEIERTINRLRKERRLLAAHNCYLANMAENLQHNPNLREENELPGGNRGNNIAHRPVVQPDDPDMLLEEFALPPTVIQSVIRRPPIQANNFELKVVTLQLLQGIQFHGLPSEDPNTHLTSFLEVCDNVKYNGVTEEAIRLRLFPLSLSDRAKQWLTSEPPDSIISWADLVQKFLTKYCPPAKTAQMRIEINSFAQKDSESLTETWDRYKELLRKCPHHGLTRWMQIYNFYTGLNAHTRQMIDTSAGGIFLKRTTQQAFDLLDGIATNSYQWSQERMVKGNGNNGVTTDVFSNLAAQVSLLTKQLQNQQASAHAIQTSSVLCEICSGSHQTMECQSGQMTLEQAQYIARYNQQQQNPYVGNNFQGQGWRNNQNFPWKKTQNSGQPMQSNIQLKEKKVDLEEALAHMMTSHTAFMNETKANFQNQAQQLQNQSTQLQNQGAQLRNLEVQMGQMATMLSERPQGSLPSTLEVNPRGEGKEHCKAITLRSGREVAAPGPPPVIVTELKQSDQDEEKVNTEQKDGELPQPNSSTRKQSEVEKVDKPFSQDPIPFIPYPQRLRKSKLDKQFTKFMEVFKKLQINIPFADALEQMPTYVKFMKDILSKKRRLEEYETIALTEECSAIIQKKLPQKLKDPGSFTIPCTIGNAVFERALCDLGASINLMPLSIFRRLGLGEAKPTTVTLQLADRSLKHPRGIIEDVLVKVDKFIFPADFIVLDMEEDKEIPIILGRPFLATGRALIDVQKGELRLRVQDEEVRFSVFRAIKHPAESDSCYRIENIEAIVSNHEDTDDPLETRSFRTKR